MKKLVLPFLCVLMLCLSSCMKTGDNISNYQDIPAIVGISHETFQPTIITSVGTFLAPELSNYLYTDLYEGDAIWIYYFSINFNQPAISGEYIADNIRMDKVDEGWVQESISDGFDVPIQNFWVADLVGNVMFCVFEHTAPADKKFKYEMTYESNETSELELCIGAKNDDTESSGIAGTFAFNMSYFFMTNKNADNVVKFKIKYKTGVDDAGNDQYTYYASGNTFEVKVE